MHIESLAIPSLNLSFLDQATPHVEPLSRPPTESNVVVARSTISHLLSLDLLSLSSIQKYAFHVAMTMLQSASLEPKAGAFISRVIHRALEVFSSIEHVVKKNSQVISCPRRANQTVGRRNGVRKSQVVFSDATR